MSDQPETMTTAKGRRIIARPCPAGVSFTIFNIRCELTIDESMQLRTLLDDAENAHLRGEYDNA